MTCPQGFKQFRGEGAACGEKGAVVRRNCGPNAAGDEDLSVIHRRGRGRKGWEGKTTVLMRRKGVIRLMAKMKVKESPR